MQHSMPGTGPTPDATAPEAADGVRRLMTAEIAVDGVSQGPVAEALVTVAE